MLQCVVLLSGLLTVQHGFFLIRLSFGDRDLTDYPLWFLEPKVQGKPIAIDWGKDQLRTAEAMLTTFLHCDSSNLLATCPDTLFACLVFAGSIVIGLRIYTQARMGVHMRGPGEKLLQRTSGVLKGIALDEGHIAMRSAKVIDTMLDLWAEKLKELKEGDPASASQQPSGDFAGYIYNDEDFWSQFLGTTVDGVPPS